MKKLLAILLASVLLPSVAVAQSFAPYVFNKDFKTSAATTLYVDPATGSDTNRCTITAKCQTVASALSKLPKIIRHPVTVSLAAGTYPTGWFIEGFQFLPATTAGAYLNIEGTFVNATVATGTATGTATAVVTGSFATQSWGTVTDSTQTWTVDGLRGKLLEITGGSGVGQIRAIDSNTATVITIAGGWAASGPTAGSTYAIRDWGTIVTGGAPGVATIRDAAPSASALVTLGENIYGAGSPYVVGVQRVKFASTTASLNAVQVRSKGGLLLRYNNFAGSSSNQINSLSDSDISLYYNTASLAAGTAWFIHQATWGVNSFSEGNVVVGGANGMKIRTWHNAGAINGSSFRNMSDDMIQVGSGTFGLVRGCKFDTTSGGYCIDSDYNFSTTTMPTFSMTITGTSMNGCALGGIRAQDGGNYVLTDVTGSNTGPGITVNKGGRVRIATTTAVTGSAAISVDGVTSTYAALRALSPKQITNTTTLSTIWEP